MKKFITLLLPLFFLGYAFASMTPSEQKTLEYVTSFLQDNGTVIDQRVGDSEDLQMSAQGLREALLEDLLALDPKEESYATFKMMLVTYVQTLAELKEVNNLPRFEEFEQPVEAILSLQNHIRSEVNNGQDIQRPIHENTTLEMTLRGMLPFVGQVEGMWNIVGDSKVDLSRQVMESVLAMDMDFSISSSMDEIDESLAARGLLDIKMPGNDMMYIGMKDVEVGGMQSDDEMTQYIVEQMTDILKDAYIRVPLEGGATEDMMYIDTLAARYAINQYMTEKPLIRFHHKEGNRYYGFFSHDMCDMLEAIGMDVWTVNDCHESIDDMLKMTEGKGPIVLTITNGMYDISLYDFNGEMSTYFKGVKIVSWNDQRVVKASMPFDDLGNGITYRGGVRDLDLNDEDVAVNISIENEEGQMTIEGTMIADGMTVTIDGNFDSSADAQVGSLVIAISQGGIELGVFTLDIDTQVRTIGSFDVVIPTNSMTMDEFTQMMEERMMEFYMQ